MQYNQFSTTPNFGTFINQNDPPFGDDYPPPANQVPWQSTSFDYGQMNCLSQNTVVPDPIVGQMPMGNVLSLDDALPVNGATPTFAAGDLDDTEAYAQPRTDVMGYDGFSEDWTVAGPNSQVFLGQAV